MIMDIVDIPEGSDLVLLKSDIARAGNVLAVQIGDLEYAINFGVDLKYFVTSEYQFQNASFQSYLINRLVESQVNVVQCIETLMQFVSVLTFEIGDPTIGQNNQQGMVIA